MRKGPLLLSIPLVLLLLSLGLFLNESTNSSNIPQKLPATQKLRGNAHPDFVEKLLNDFSFQYSLFKKASIENGKYIYRNSNFTVTFTVDPLLQKAAEDEIKRFKVKYGAFVALEAKTGKVKAIVSSIPYPDLALKNTFPTASTFKIVTAAAAIELGVANPDTEMVCGGLGDSCSPTVWLNSYYKVKRKFKTSFATSANPFFGNLGRLIGKEKLMEYAKKFGFNRKDYGFPWGFVRKPLDDYDLALIAAGLGEARTSPLHEALIAQVIENRGIMLKPFLVEEIRDKNGKVLFKFKKEILQKVIAPKTAEEIKEMMYLTVKIGTVASKKYFRKLRRLYPEIGIGGKTGTLSELTYPEGRCEWFTGFAEYGDEKLAITSLAINDRFFHITGYELAAVISMHFAKLK